MGTPLQYKTIYRFFAVESVKKSARHNLTVTIGTKNKNCQPAKNFRTGAHSRFVFVEKSFQPNRHDGPVRATLNHPNDPETKYSPGATEIIVF